jgi:hypothetical protein
MKKLFSSLKIKLNSFFKRIWEKCVRAYMTLRAHIIEMYQNFIAWHGSLEKRKQNRVTVLILSLVIIANYLMICYHTGKNPASIFPSLPVLDFRDKVSIYIPSPDGSLLKESRLIDKDSSTEDFIKRLTVLVIQGSSFENTRAMTPIRGSVRKAWVYDGECYIDIRFEILEPDAPSIPGSEKLFRQALEKTILLNIKGIRKVLVLENGIPDKNMWDLSSI